MIDEIRLSAMFSKFRGMPEINRKSLAKIIQRLSFISLLHPEIKEIDVNPIIFNGPDPIAVDALIVL